MTTRSTRTPTSSTRRKKSNGTSNRKVSSAEHLARLRAENTRLKAQLRAARAAARAKLGTEANVSGRTAESSAALSDNLPALPAADANGHYPALEFAYASLARTIITRRRAAGWSQAELAAKAGVRTETINRLESARHSPNVRTVERIDAALKRAGV
jgi:ribosome-binding protein aMBF1 (putative translation factor)